MYRVTGYLVLIFFAAYLVVYGIFDRVIPACVNAVNYSSEDQEIKSIYYPIVLKMCDDFHVVKLMVKEFMSDTKITKGEYNRICKLWDEERKIESIQRLKDAISK